MTKKKTPAVQDVEQPKIEEQTVVDQEPQPEVPERQIEETPIEQKPDEQADPKPIEVAKPEIKIEPIKTTPEATGVAEPPKPLTMEILNAKIEALQKQIEQLMQAPPIKQRKPVTSNGKVAILDTKTGKVYPSKNNVYKSLLHAHELDDLVAKGVFGADPEHNSFGCYSLFNAYPGRFVPQPAENGVQEVKTT